MIAEDGWTDLARADSFGARPLQFITCAHLPAIAGISVAVVAPEPMTTTRLPPDREIVRHAIGCTTRPSKRPMPCQSGV